MDIEPEELADRRAARWWRGQPYVVWVLVTLALVFLLVAGVWISNLILDPPMEPDFIPGKCIQNDWGFMNCPGRFETHLRNLPVYVVVALPTAMFYPKAWFPIGLAIAAIAGLAALLRFVANRI